MKVYRITILLTLIFGVLYYLLESELFYYGKNNFNIFNSLPLKIKPDSRPNYEGGFALRDEYGFTIAAKGNTYEYNGTIIKIKEILKYCFDNDNVIVLVNDDNNSKYYIEFSNKMENYEKKKILVNVRDSKYVLNIDKYKCKDFKSDDKHIVIIELYRNYLTIILLGLFLFLFYKTLKLIIKNNK